MALASIISSPFRLSLRENIKGASDAGVLSRELLLVDITQNETVNREAEVTSNPVEEGPDVNDNVRIKPVGISLTGFVSESPLNLATSIQGLAGAAGGAVGNLAGGFGGTIGRVAGGFGAKLLTRSQDPSQVAREFLEKLFEEKRLVTVQTKRKAYEDMILVSLTFPRDASSGKGLAFQARFQQINIISAQTVQISRLDKSVSHSAAPTSKLGNQSPTNPTGQVGAKGSILYQGIFGSLL